jgi:predicted transcriptional regulator/transcriptional regulator with XRE-family HTH domain
MSRRKLFVGHKLRRLREQRALTQAAMARLLDLSPSYLNQLESNQRPLTVTVLLRVARALNVDVATLAEDEEARLIADLREVAADPLFVGEPPTVSELRAAATAAPTVAHRMLSLYQAYQQLHERLQSLSDRLSQEHEVADAAVTFPYEEVRDYFYYCNNYFDSLDRAAEALAEVQGFRPPDLQPALTRYLREVHDVRVAVEAETSTVMRRFDPATRTLHLGGHLDGASRAFHMAHQVALLAHADLIDGLIAEAPLSSDDAKAICRVGLANYFAGALLLPYGAFAGQARAQRHDIEILASRFGASLEQVCHRLSTLQRPGQPGVPFYFMRVDQAGNITKRHSAARLHFARFGGTCPKWNIHEAFARPGRILPQLATMPDGATFVCIAFAVTKSGGAYLRPSRQFALGLGCEVAYADEVVYSAGLALDNPETAEQVGVNCRICERTDCQQRAFPPIGGKVTVDANNRSLVPYVFA